MAVGLGCEQPELAYVAMSRARESTHVWTAADDTAQAVEDLRRDWERRRSPGWRQRRAAAKDQTAWEGREADAQRRYELHVVPELARLGEGIDLSHKALDEAQARQDRYRRTSASVAEFSIRSSLNSSRLSAHLARYRNEIDGVGQATANVSRPPQLRSSAPDVEPPSAPLPGTASACSSASVRDCRSGGRSQTEGSVTVSI